MKKKTIFLSLPYPSSIKNLISDEFLKKFKGHKIIIFSCLLKLNSNFLKTLKKHNVIYVKYNRPNFIIKSITFLINNLTTIRLLKKKNITTLETFIKMHNSKCSNEIIKPFRFLNNKFLKFFSYFNFFILILKIIRFLVMLFTSFSYIFLFIKYKPDIFFTAHPFANEDLPLQQISNILRLKKIALIHSWDNITSKFKMHFNYDKILVWNKIQKDQLKYIYEYADSKLKIVGAPFIDDFVKYKKIEKKKFFKKNKLDINKKLIVIFGTSEHYVPHLEKIFIKINDIVDNKELIKDTQLWIRPHPTSKLDYEKIFKNKLSMCMKPPKSFVSLNSSIIGNYKEENMFFINLIYHSDIVISFFSSTIIDATYFNKPIINPLIEFKNKKDSYCSISSYVNNWSHMKDIKNTNGVSFVTNYTMLKKEINRYYSNKNFKSLGRKKIFDTQINFNLGRSRVAIANEIIE